MSDVAIASELEESKKEQPVTEHPVREIKSAEPVVERKTEALKLEDIDKKLEELLETDLSRV